jgi:sulfonate transport system substrate-binding protein
MINKNIRIGGVPEHFNTPFHWKEGKEIFEKAGLHIEWHSFPGGTGAMNKALRNNEIDIAILLTEGGVADICQGNPSKIVRFFVDSPLIWGVHVASHHTEINQISQLKNKPFAVSRMGSGSHLMASIMAEDLGWEREQAHFEIVGNLDGAREAMKHNKAYGFLWEKFTTQPYVENGEFKLIGEVPTPWPCFAIMVRDEYIKNRGGILEPLFEAINKSSSLLSEHSNRAEIIAKHANLKPESVETWLQSTHWSTSNQMDMNIIDKVIKRLQKNAILNQDKTYSTEDIIFQLKED